MAQEHRRENQENQGWLPSPSPAATAPAGHLLGDKPGPEHLTRISSFPPGPWKVDPYLRHPQCKEENGSRHVKRLSQVTGLLSGKGTTWGNGAGTERLLKARY